MPTLTRERAVKGKNGLYVPPRFRIKDDVDREIERLIGLTPQQVEQVHYVRSLLESALPAGYKDRPRYDGYSVRELKKAIDIARKHNLCGALGYVECVVAMKQSSALFTTFTTAKTIIDGSGLWDAPRNYLYSGRKFRCRGTGALSNIVKTPGTITFQLMIGSVIAWTSGAIQLNATAHTTLPWTLDISFTVQAFGPGTATKILGVGTLEGRMFTLTAGQTDDAQGMQTIVVPVTNPAQGTGFDGTVQNTIDFWGGFSISNAGNGVRTDEYSQEFLN
jgi:hypothetical protein